MLVWRNDVIRMLQGCFVLIAIIPPRLRLGATYDGLSADYSKLRKDKDGALQYVNPELRTYSQSIVEPVYIRPQRTPPVLKTKETIA